MANNPNVNKVVYGNQTVIDITDTTAEPENVLEGEVFYDRSGTRQTGSAVIPDISNCYQTTDTAETDIADGDYFPFYDTSATAKRKTLWSNIKAKLNEIFFRRSEANILGAKNILPQPYPNNTTFPTGTNVRFTLNEDYSISATGTTGSSSEFISLSSRSDTDDTLKLQKGSYVFSGNPNTDGTTYIAVNTTVNGSIYRIVSSETEGNPTEVDFTITDELLVPGKDYATIGLIVGVPGNKTVSNAVFKPMMRLASDPDDTFVPYTLTNKELTDALKTKADTSSLAEVATSGSYNDLEDTPTIPNELADLSDDATHRLVTDTEKSTWNGKQDALTFDNTPTASSDNPVKSGGIKTALDAKYDKALANVLGAKNLLPYPYSHTTKTVNGVTFTDVGDGTILVNTDENGATADATFEISANYTKVPLKEGRYILSGCPSGGGSLIFGYQFVLKNINTSAETWKADFGDSVTFEQTSTVKFGYSRINIKSGTVCDNLLFKPMIRLASDPDDTWQPYAKTNRELTVDKCENSVVAPVENGTTASQAYAIGEHFIRDGAFCTAKTAIASGATLTLNTNYTAGQIGEGIGGINNIIRKSYTLTGASSGDYFYVYRIGNLRIIEAKITNTSAGDRMLTLDAIDRPSSDIFISGCAATKTGVLKIYSTGYVDKSTTSTVAELYYAPYVVGYTSV